MWKNMEDEAPADVQPTPRYEGEDLRPTSEKELRGWYTYGLAAEVFAVCGVGSFLPLVLEQLAREEGVFRSDGTSCSDNVDANNNTTLLLRASGHLDNVCVIHLFGTQINTASFAMYTFSVAVLVQALVLVSCSSVADYGNNRKRLLLTFGLTGSTATMLFLLVFPKIYFLGSLLVIVGVTCLGSSFVILNSFLPLLVSNHPSLRGASNHQQDPGLSPIPLENWAPITSDTIDINQNDSHASESDSQGEGLLERKELNNLSVSPHVQLSAQISSRGVGIGYLAAVFVQTLSILLIYFISESSSPSSSKTVPLRFVLFFVGLWWFVFTLVSGLWLRNRPGPPLASVVSQRGRSWRSCLAYPKFAWVSLWQTIKVALKLQQVVIFLLAWILLSDAIATVSGTAILFAKTELNMSTTAIAVLSILSTISGVVGAFSWPIISRRLGMRPSRTIITCISLFEIIPVYGLMGYLPFVKAWGVGGLQQAWEIYPLGFIHGFVMGGLSSYCRSFFGLLIPPGSEAAFYALYAITDKGSSVAGPAIVGMIVDATGHMRAAFWFLVVLILLPIPLIWMVDEERGRSDALAVAERMKGLRFSMSAIS